MLKKHIHIIFLTIIVSFLLVSCEKVIHLDLNSAETRIVIEGNITPDAGPYEVVITTSGDYYTAEGIMPISGAQVIISDDIGNFDTLSEKLEGIYLTNNLLGESDRTYSLDIAYKGNSYSGSEYLPVKVTIDSLSYEENGVRPPPEEPENKIYNINCNFTDPEESEDYYRFTILINGEESESRRGGNYNVTSDQLFNGNPFQYTIWYVEAAPQDTITIVMDAIGFNTYEYFRTLNDALSSGGMGGTPYNPITNLSNDALGYFGAYTRDRKSIILEE
jgi:hypothetical protein